MRYFATLFFALAASGFAVHALARLSGADPTHPPAWQLASATGILHVAGILALIPLLRIHDSGWRDGFGLGTGGWPRTGIVALVLTLPAFAVVWGVHQSVSFVLDALGHPPDPQVAVDAVRTASNAWERGLLFLFAVGTAPVFEEFVFRGILWPMLRDRGFRVAGCLMASFVFALIHFNLAAFVPLWLLGIFWTWLYERTGDLAAPMLSHTLFNATNFIWILALDPTTANAAPP